MIELFICVAFVIGVLALIFIDDDSMPNKKKDQEWLSSGKYDSDSED